MPKLTHDSDSRCAPAFPGWLKVRGVDGIADSCLHGHYAAHLWHLKGSSWQCIISMSLGRAGCFKILFRTQLSHVCVRSRGVLQNSVMSDVTACGSSDEYPIIKACLLLDAHSGHFHWVLAPSGMRQGLRGKFSMVFQNSVVFKLLWCSIWNLWEMSWALGWKLGPWVTWRFLMFIVLSDG